MVRGPRPPPPLPFTNLSGAPPIIEDTRLYHHHPSSLRHVFVTVHGRKSYSGRSAHYYVLASHDGGGSWDYLRVDAQSPTETAIEDVTWLLAADPKARNIFWAQVARRPKRGGDTRRKLLRSSNGGQTWSEVPVDRKEGATGEAVFLPPPSMSIRRAETRSVWASRLDITGTVEFSPMGSKALPLSIY